MASESNSSHLCVLIHGLWGNPTNLAELDRQLSEKYDDSEVHVLSCKTNMGNHTYDGVEVGAERVTDEIEKHIKELESDGQKIDKISIVGYSLGGLIARYTVGLLYTRGWFDRLIPVNFTTFASPHLGVRTPLVGFNNTLWNDIGARTLSVTGQQLFTVDKFRDTGRPLLEVLADRNSIFIKGLKCFRRRSLYANIINDRSVPFWTAYASRSDPFVNLDAINIDYEPGYSDIILTPTLAKPRAEPLTYYESLCSVGRTVAQRGPMLLAAAVVLPVGGLVYAANSAYQTMQSSKRVALHETGQGSGYRGLPLIVEELQHKAENAYERLNAAQDEAYLSEGSTEKLVADAHRDVKQAGLQHKSAGADASVAAHEPPNDKQMDGDFPMLALTKGQFAMIDVLDELKFEKFGVHIKKAQHSHAAIIFRRHGERFNEGRTVIKHWLERFEV